MTVNDLRSMAAESAEKAWAEAQRWGRGAYDGDPVAAAHNDEALAAWYFHDWLATQSFGSLGEAERVLDEMAVAEPVIPFGIADPEHYAAKRSEHIEATLKQIQRRGADT